MPAFKPGERVMMQSVMTVKSVDGDIVHTAWLDSEGQPQESDLLAVQLAMYYEGPNSFEPDFEI